MTASPKLMFLVTEDWYFCSHRLPPARAARDAGYEVVVATHVTKHGEQITSERFRLVPLVIQRQGRNPLRELAAILEIVRVYRRERPDILHHVALKPVLYGSLAARFARGPAIVNALTGLGFLFSSSSRLARLARHFISLAFRSLLNFGRGALILQNPDDGKLLVSRGLVAPERIRLILGSGVDVAKFHPSPEPDGVPVVMLASRMLWSKGIAEFVAAAESLRKQGVAARFVLVGESDTDHPGAVPERQLRQWQEHGTVQWWGRREDMAAALAAANIVCLPTSYGEGVPKVLIEAAACGRALIATDAPGCREIVRHGENGLLVPTNDASAFTDAVARLIADPALRAAMGSRGRNLVEEHFSDDNVARQTLAVYREFHA